MQQLQGDEASQHHPQPHPLPHEVQHQGGPDKAVPTACIYRMPCSIARASPGGICPGTANGSLDSNVILIEGKESLESLEEGKECLESLEESDHGPEEQPHKEM